MLVVELWLYWAMVSISSIPLRTGGWHAQIMEHGALVSDYATWHPTGWYELPATESHHLRFIHGGDYC